MYYRHGAYKHADNTVTVSTFAMTRQFSETGRVTQVNTMTLDGVLIASTQSKLRIAILKLEHAYLKRSAETSGFHHDNDTYSPHRLTSKGSFGGIRVRELSYPSGEGAEYATQRTFRIVLSVEQPPALPGQDQPEDEVVTDSFTETVSISGGQDRVIALSVIDGPPVLQNVGQTAMQAVQRGNMRTQGGYGTPPEPLYQDVSMTKKEASMTSPTVDAATRQFRDYGVSWSYTFIGLDIDPMSPTPW